MTILQLALVPLDVSVETLRSVTAVVLDEAFLQLGRAEAETNFGASLLLIVAAYM